MILLVDIGNSRLKWATTNGERIDVGASVDYRYPGYLSTLQQAWNCIGLPRQIAVASVTSPQILADILELTQLLWPGVLPWLAQAKACALGVQNAYPQPEKLGVDRWLALVAAHRDYGGDLCVVDCGTAITVDAVTAGGVHLGGLIAPGLWTMKQALLANTAALRVDDDLPFSSLAVDTSHAIVNGALLAAAGLIETVMRRLGSGFRLIVTGGDASAVVSVLQAQFMVDGELVFKGLAAVCAVEGAA